MTTIYQVSDLVRVEEDTDSVRVVIECDDRTGAGFVLERIRPILGDEAIPADWLQILNSQGTT